LLVARSAVPECWPPAVSVMKSFCLPDTLPAIWSASWYLAFSTGLVDGELQIGGGGGAGGVDEAFAPWADHIPIGGFGPQRF